VAGELRAVRYEIDADRMLAVRPAAYGFDVAVEQIPFRTELASARGAIRDSLFNAVDEAGESPELAMRLAEIFGWDLDFYSDPRKGDTFRVLVEKKTSLDGRRTTTYGPVLAAEYVNDGHPYQAVLFHDAAGAPAYYSADGKSLQKAFLRSPLKFAAPVTSRFSGSRFHPILHTSRAHLGVDYGAPIGTPVQAIGGGRVIFAGAKSGDGNMVRIRHANGYESMYLHLSRILVRAGERVEAGDRIGLVGMTGLATGPHLDFRIVDHGVFRNFETLRRNLPPSEPVVLRDMAEFLSVRDRVMPQLDDGALLSTAGDSSKSPSGAARMRPAAVR
jgi:murein DD-endopeptidase MepM/ murein hydrolase activator NlpD